MICTFLSDVWKDSSSARRCALPNYSGWSCHGKLWQVCGLSYKRPEGSYDQEHVTKGQIRHTELYNKKVKGPTIEVGDRVWLAARENGERDSCRSLGVHCVHCGGQEHWHTYIQDMWYSNRKKMVHRNLLMLGNFKCWLAPDEGRGSLADEAGG